MKNYLIGGILLIVLINIVVLTGVAYNRSDPQINTIELSGREFRLPYGYGLASENSAKMVSLVTRMPNKEDVDDRAADSIFSAALTEQQLARVGLVDLEYPQGTANEASYQYYYKQHQVEVYLAVEFNGTEYQSALKVKQDQLNDLLIKMETLPDSVSERELKNAKRRLEKERNTASRLFYVDANVDSNELIQKYKDQANILVTKGQINISYNNENAAYSVSYANLLIDKIMLPSEIANSVSHDSISDHNLLFTLHIGKRFEPWVSRLEMQK